MRVHRLVAMAFIPNAREDAQDVNHIDGNKKNNSVENLEWCTKAENARHSCALGLQAVGERIGISKLTQHKVLDVRRRYESGESAFSIALSLNVDRSTVHNIVSGKTWTHI